MQMNFDITANFKQGNPTLIFILLQNDKWKLFEPDTNPTYTSENAPFPSSRLSWVSTFDGSIIQASL